MGAVITWFFEHLKTKRERLAKEAAEKKLAEIKRRASAPYLICSETAFNHLYVRKSASDLQAWSAGARDLLCFLRDEVDRTTPSGETIGLVIDNLGQSARAIAVRIDGERVAFQREADFQGSHGLYFFTYPYVPEKHGKDQIVTLNFESDDGIQDTHKYITKHGIRILRRIDPKLPD